MRQGCIHCKAKGKEECKPDCIYERAKRADRNPEELIKKYWPWLREVFVSPLTKGDDVISGWQVEINWCGSHTFSFCGNTIDQAYHQAKIWLDQRFSEAEKNKRGV